MSQHTAPPPLPDPVKVEVIANHDRVKLTDARLLLIFLLLMVILGGAGTYVKVQLDAVTSNCQSNRANTESFNAFITRIQAVTLGAPNLTQAQREQRVKFYQAAKQPVPRCPNPPWGHIDGGDTDKPSAPATKPLPLP